MLLAAATHPVEECYVVDFVPGREHRVPAECCFVRQSIIFKVFNVTTEERYLLN